MPQRCLSGARPRVCGAERRCSRWPCCAAPPDQPRRPLPLGVSSCCLPGQPHGMETDPPHLCSLRGRACSSTRRLHPGMSPLQAPWGRSGQARRGPRTQVGGPRAQAGARRGAPAVTCGLHSSCPSNDLLAPAPMQGGFLRQCQPLQSERPLRSGSQIPRWGHQ